MRHAMIHQSGSDVSGERTTYLAETTGQLGTSRGLDLISVWLGSYLLSWSDSYVCEMAEQDSVGREMWRQRIAHTVALLAAAEVARGERL